MTQGIQDMKAKTVSMLNAMNPTLDGKPAVVGGAKSEWLGVSALDGSTGTVEFSWGTALHFVKKGKADFKS